VPITVAMLVDLLTRFQEFMDASSSEPWALFLVLMVVGQAAAIALHEAAHAIVAARYGTPVYEIAAAPEGPALRFRFAGVPVRIGLGLTRDGRSEDPLGWVCLDPSSLTVEQHRRVLLAGPLAEMVFGAVAVAAVAFADLNVLAHVMLGLNTGSILLRGARNLTSDSPDSDGGRIRLLRQGVKPPTGLTPGRHVIMASGRESIVDVAPDGRWMLSFFEAPNEETAETGRWVTLFERSGNGWEKSYFDADTENWAPTHVDPIRGQLGVAFAWGDPHTVEWDAGQFSSKLS
jgi:hypothetical protein